MNSVDNTALRLVDYPCVYAVRADVSGHIKIGFSARMSGVRKRIAAVQTGCSEPLRVVTVLMGDQTVERELHKIWGRRRLHGEWFDDRDSVISEWLLCCPGAERDRVLLGLADAQATLEREADKESIARARATEARIRRNRYVERFFAAQDAELARERDCERAA